MIGIKPGTGLALIALTFIAMALPGAEERPRAGLWEISTSEGKQAGRFGNTCYTPAMVLIANMPEKMMQEATEKTLAKRGCTLKDFKMDGNKVSFVDLCSGRSAMIVSTYMEARLKRWIRRPRLALPRYTV